MSEAFPFVVPWIKQSSELRVPRVPIVMLEKLVPNVKDLQPHCVPSPFAEAEVMELLLRSLPVLPGAPFEDVSPTKGQQQSFQRWKVLIKALLLGRIAVENVWLPSADNFGRALMQSRVGKEFQGVIRAQDVAGLHVVGRRGRVVGGTDEETFVWAAPRIESGWSFLDDAVVGGDELLALDLLHAWRAMLFARGLWAAEGAAPAWMRGVDRMLHEYQPRRGWQSLKDDVKLTGPTRLQFVRQDGDAFLLDVYVPAYAPGWAARFRGSFRLRPQITEGGIDLVGDTSGPHEGKVGQTLQLSVGQRQSAPNAATLTHSGGPREENSLLAGMGSLKEVDPAVLGDRWWLQDRDNRQGYKTVVYTPLLQRVLQIHGRALQVTAEDIGRCPVLFPDAIRLAHDLLTPPEHKSGVEFVTLKDKHTNRVRGWPFPMYGWQLAPGVAPPLPDAKDEWVLALEDSPSASCLLERLPLGNGVVVEVGELRALGALLWEMFLGEAEYKQSTSLAINRTSLSAGEGDKLASEARETEPRIVLNEALLTAVGSELHPPGAGQYRKGVQSRRATAQRFLALWTGPAAGAGPGGWLGSLASRAFLAWAFHGVDPLEAWGQTPDPERCAERRLMVTKTLAVPVYADVYPRKC